MSLDMFGRYTEQHQLQQVPLAIRMRPKTLYGFVGQKHLLEKGRVLQRAIEYDHIPPMIFCGPTGSGKTSLANVIAFSIGAYFAPINAASASVADLRKIVAEAIERYQITSQRTILFINEIHRFGKPLQNALLPFVNNGIVIFIGATTENPSFEVTSPLLSRMRIIPLKRLTEEELKIIIFRAITDTLQGIGKLNVELEPNALEYLVKISNGNARMALNILEIAALTTPVNVNRKRIINPDTVEDTFKKWVVQHISAPE
ncbi:MAG: AAA family ATPase [Dehalococcoidales bacterium]